MNEQIKQVLDYVAQNEYLKAKDILQDLIRQEPETEIFYELYGYCLRRLETDDLEDSFPHAPHRAEGLFAQKAFEKMYKKAEAVSQKGDYRRASVLWQMTAVYAEKKLTENPPAHTVLPSTELRQLSRVYYAKAVCDYLQGNLTAAKESFNRSREIELHAFRDYSLTVARIYARTGNRAQADDILLTALGSKDVGVADYEIHRERAEIFEKEGNVSCAQSEYELARTDLEERLQKEPLDMHLYSIMADVLDKLGRTDEALKANAKAVALWSTFPKTYYQRAKLLASRKDEKGALHQLSLGKSCEVYYPTAHALEEGEIYERLGKWKEAEKCYLSCADGEQRYQALKHLYGTRNAPKKWEKYVQRMKSKKCSFWGRVSEEELVALNK